MSRLARVLAVIASLVAGTKLLPAQSCATKLPFTLYQDYSIVVRGSVPGLNKKLNFIVDTGAVPTVLDSRVARKLALRGQVETLSVFNKTVETRRVNLPGLMLGPLSIGPLPVIVEDLTVFGQQLGIRVDGMIGLDVLSRCNFTIDYDAETLSFGSVSSNGNGGQSLEASVPFDLAPGYAVVRLDVEGQPVRLMVDTGAKSLVLFAPRVRERLGERQILRNRTIGNLDGKVDLTEVRLTGARLGATELGATQVSLMEGQAPRDIDLDGLLGVRSLGARRIEFDFQNRMMSWAR